MGSSPVFTYLVIMDGPRSLIESNWIYPEAINYLHIPFDKSRAREENPNVHLTNGQEALGAGK